MKIRGIDFPRPILNALRDDKLVVFAGAGVSMGKPASLPSFTKLAMAIAQGTGEELKENEPEDRFLGRLKHKGVDVHKIAAEELKKNCCGKIPKPADLHRDLLKLYPESMAPRIVTTNFDTLFEQAEKCLFVSRPDVFTSPALPPGGHFTGIVHVHGVLSRPKDMVLTDADFGRAYLTEGWARRFLVDVFRSYTVLFVGYRHNDTIMNYLSRALPVDETESRFAVTHETDDNRWQYLGIEPITYVKSSDNDHGALYRGVNGLAKNTRRSILGWKREITEIATNPPPLDEEEIDLIEEALRDATKTRFFTDAAHSFEWIDWLEKRDHLSGLFGNSDLNKRDVLLVEWIAEKFARANSDELFLLISRHNLRLHPKFWLQLCRAISSQDECPLTVETLSRWVSILVETVPAPHVMRLNKPDALQKLAEYCNRCNKDQLMESIVAIFDTLAASHQVITPGFYFPDDKSNDPKPPINVNLAPMSDYYFIDDLWETLLKPNLQRSAEPLLPNVVRHLASQHQTLCAWRAATIDWNPLSDARNAIEPHQKDKNPVANDVLIDAARDCLEWFSSNRPVKAARWCDQLADAESPLLRRLATHTLSVRKDLNPSEKIDWVLAHMDLHDSSARHELFRVLRLTYPDATQQQRRAVLRAVLAYRSPEEEDEDKEKHTAYYHFEWLHWLNGAAPDCSLTAKALNDVLRQYPSLEPSEYPDLNYWISSGPRGHQSPWTVDELLSQSADDWVGELLSFQKTEFRGPDRLGLVHAVSEAGKQRFEWGVDLADALAARDTWDTDIWDTLLRVWSDIKLDQKKALEILNRLHRTELYTKYARPISEFLYKLVMDGDRSDTHLLFPKANRVAANLWPHVDRSEVRRVFDSWLTTAINHPAGFLAGFWLSSINYWRKQHENTPESLSEEYRDALSEIVKDKTVAGRLGRSVLARDLSFLLHVDTNWTETNLIPLFTRYVNVDDYQAVWNGLLYGSLSPPVAELIGDAFLEAVSRIMSELSHEGQRQFIRRYITMLAYFAGDPLEAWIPRFFEHANEFARRFFAIAIGDSVQTLNDAQQQEWWQRWLKSYWENRLQGVPERLSDGEMGIMFFWLPEFRGVFPDAVNLAVEMQPEQFTNRTTDSGRIVYLIEKGDLSERHPEAVAKLLIHLGRIKSRPRAWSKGKELIDKLLKANLSCEQKQQLKELAAERGMT